MYKYIVGIPMGTDLILSFRNKKVMGVGSSEVKYIKWMEKSDVIKTKKQTKKNKINRYNEQIAWYQSLDWYHIISLVIDITFFFILVGIYFTARYKINHVIDQIGGKLFFMIRIPLAKSARKTTLLILMGTYYVPLVTLFFCFFMRVAFWRITLFLIIFLLNIMVSQIYILLNLIIYEQDKLHAQLNRAWQVL